MTDTISASARAQTQDHQISRPGLHPLTYWGSPVNSDNVQFYLIVLGQLTLLRFERPKLCGVLAVLSAIGLTCKLVDQ